METTLTLVHSLDTPQTGPRAHAWLRGAALAAGLFAAATNASAGSILFIGNSFTYAQG
jgi:hypothetical protein